MFRKIEISYLFFRDMLRDVARKNRCFLDEYDRYNEIIKIWDRLIENADCKIKIKNIHYRYDNFIFPDQFLWKMKIFSKQEKKEIIESVVNILNMQDKLFFSLKVKLKKYSRGNKEGK
jgi:hypothetical protein